MPHAHEITSCVQRRRRARWAEAAAAPPPRWVARARAGRRSAIQHTADRCRYPTARRARRWRLADGGGAARARLEEQSGVHGASVDSAATSSRRGTQVVAVHPGDSRGGARAPRALRGSAQHVTAAKVPAATAPSGAARCSRPPQSGRRRLSAAAATSRGRPRMPESPRGPAPAREPPRAAATQPAIRTPAAAWASSSSVAEHRRVVAGAGGAQRKARTAQAAALNVRGCDPTRTTATDRDRTQSTGGPKVRSATVSRVRRVECGTW